MLLYAYLYNPMPCTDHRLQHNAVLRKEWIVYYGMLYAAIIQCLNDGITAFDQAAAKWPNHYMPAWVN